MIVGHAREEGETLPDTAPALALPASFPLGVELLGKSVAVPALGLGGLVTGLGCRALVPLTVRSRMDENALAVTHHAPLLPMCGLVAPSHGLLTATVTDEYARVVTTIALVIDWPSQGPA